MNIRVKAMLLVSMGTLVVAFLVAALSRHSLEEALSDAARGSEELLAETSASSFERVTIRLASSLAERAATKIDERDAPWLRDFVRAEALDNADILGIAVMDAEGRTMAEAGHPPATAPATGRDPRRRAALESTHADVRWEEERLLAWAPVKLRGTRVGTMWIEQNLDRHRTALAQMRSTAELSLADAKAGADEQLAVLVLSSLLLGLAVSFMLGLTLTQRIAGLARVIGRVSLGDREARVKPMGKDEIGAMAGQLNEMLDQLEASRREMLRREQLERDLETAQRKAAEAAAEAKSAFLANMSHELRTPLHGIIGTASLLQGTSLSPAQADHVETIGSSADALQTLVSDVLDFSRLEAGRLELDEMDFDLRVCVEDVVQLLAAQTHLKDIELAFTFDAAVPRWVRGDPGRLRQILMNLVGNAVKFTDSGEVAVRVLPEPKGDYDNQRGIRLEVSDTGPGIPPEDREELFGRFVRGESAVARVQGGAGLGLAICRELASLMRGEISLDSEVGNGSTFQVDLSFVPAEQPPEPPEGVADVPPGLRVLVIDDSALAREVTVGMLRAIGVAADACEHSQLALDLLRMDNTSRPTYHAAIVDVRMPDIDGLSLVREIRHTLSRGRLPVVMVTAYPYRGQAAEAVNVGADAYLSKPFRLRQLSRCLARVVGQQGAAEEEKTPPRRLVTRHSIREDEAAARRRVLLAEDDAVSQKIVAYTVQGLGWSCDVVSNGREAVEAAGRASYDLIIMDRRMPEMDGREATRLIRAAEPEGSRVPILGLSADASPTDRVRCLEAGMDEYYSKPLSAERLGRIIGELFADPAGEAPSSEGADAARAAGIFDRAAALEMTLGNEEILENLLSDFLDDAPERIENIATALQDGDADAMRDSAHRLKGTASYVCAERLRGIAEHVERKAREGALDGVEPLVDGLREALSELSETLGRA
jgi:signal transduction histidine kinase/CheY-like chemotaxis protein